MTKELNIISHSEKTIAGINLAELEYGSSEIPITREITRLFSGDGQRSKGLFSSVTKSGVIIFEMFRANVRGKRGTTPHLCVPLSMGCPIGCTMCGVGDFFARNIPPDHILSAISSTLPSQYENSQMQGPVLPPKIMFLGGGELGLYPKAIELLKGVRKLSPQGEIIASTVGIQSGISRDLEEYAAKDGNVGIQVSLCSLNDSLRRQLVPHKSAMNVAESLSYVTSLAANARIKPYISLLLIEGIDTPQSVTSAVKSLVDQKIHITLTDVVEASSRWNYRAANSGIYDQTASMLQASGYDVSVYRPAVDADLYDSCGLYMPITPALNESTSALKRILKTGKPQELASLSANHPQFNSKGNILVFTNPAEHKIDNLPYSIGLVVNDAYVGPIHYADILTVAKVKGSKDWVGNVRHVPDNLIIQSA